MYNAHLYFSLKNFGKNSVYYTWQNMVATCLMFSSNCGDDFIKIHNKNIPELSFLVGQVTQ